MLPADWASPDAPDQVIEVGSADYQSLLNRLADLGPSVPFDAVVSVAVQNRATHVLWERQYIDADYRDEFANFYASTFPPHPDRCERIHFFRVAHGSGQSTENLGYSVVRPINRRPVSRTMVRPPEDIEEFVSCTTTSSTFPLGNKFQVTGFPFLGQDTQYGVCAHAAVWMICHYHHLRFRQARRYMSDIVRSAGAVQTEDRLLPSQGLTAAQIARAFQELKLPAVHYDLASLPNNETCETIACRYLNSRLPVLLATRHHNFDGHATVLIGYRKSQTDSLEFVRQNDAASPYEIVDPVNDPCGDWIALMVPMPGKIYMSGETAEAVGTTYLMQGARDQAVQSMIELEAQEKLDFRSYVIEARIYKSLLEQRNVPTDVTPLIKRLSTSQWIWVVEAQDRDAASSGRKCVVGEIVLDATSSGVDTPLIMYLPGAAIIWPELIGSTSTFSTSQNGDDYAESGTAIHVR